LPYIEWEEIASCMKLSRPSGGNVRSILAPPLRAMPPHSNAEFRVSWRVAEIPKLQSRWPKQLALRV
jgi:hypothetical protein